MSNEDLATRIIAFVRHCGHPANPFAAACHRGWIDGAGRPTAAGRSLIEALGQQEGTRSVFRLVL